MAPTNAAELPPWAPLNEPATAFAAGILALAAALAAALASKMAAPLFGAMIAVGLAGNAGMLAVHETEVARWALGRALAWALAAAGWIVFAVLLLHTPLAYPDALRTAAAGLIALGGLMRVVDWIARGSVPTPGPAVSVFFSAAAIAVLWLGSSRTLTAGPLHTIAIAACLELCAAASAWLAVAWLEHTRRRSELIERARTRAAIRYKALHQS
jgi:hypothetical protein